MIRKQTLYCLGCSQLISREKANKTFRTGFYRVIYPLAFCNDCTKRESLREQDLYDSLHRPYSEHSSTETTVAF